MYTFDQNCDVRLPIGKPLGRSAAKRSSSGKYAALDFQETIFLANANEGRTREAHLRTADAHLNKLRLYLRLAHQWEWLNASQYAHVSRMVAEVGRLLGGWLKQTQGVKK